MQALRCYLRPFSLTNKGGKLHNFEYVQQKSHRFLKKGSLEGVPSHTENSKRETEETKEFQGTQRRPKGKAEKCNPTVVAVASTYVHM